MDVVAAYRDVGTFRGAAAVCGVDPKTVKRKVLAHERAELDDVRAERAPVPKNTDGVRAVVADLVRLERTAGAPRSVCCRRRGPPGMPVRRGTSGGWSPG